MVSGMGQWVRNRLLSSQYTDYWLGHGFLIKNTSGMKVYLFMGDLQNLVRLLLLVAVTHHNDQHSSNDN